MKQLMMATVSAAVFGLLAVPATRKRRTARKASITTRKKNAEAGDQGNALHMLKGTPGGQYTTSSRCKNKKASARLAFSSFVKFSLG